MIQPYRISLVAAIACCTLFAVSFLASCNRDCKDTTCLNGGVCDDGKCKCPTSYEGDGCESSVFEGEWKGFPCTSTCGIGHIAGVKISPNAQGDMLLEFYHHGYTLDKRYPYPPIYAKTMPAGTLQIIKGNLYPSGNIGGGPSTMFISGELKEHNDTISYQYNFEIYISGNPHPRYPSSDTSYQQHCSGIYVRQ